MSLVFEKDLLEENGGSAGNGAPSRPHEEAQEIVRALTGGEVDAVVVEEQGEHQLMALAKLTDLEEISELVRALKNGEVDAFIAHEEGTEKVYSVTPIHEVLAQQYNLTKAITDNATTALFILDADQQCVFMNPAAEELTGFSFEEVRARGGALHEIIHHTRPDGSVYPLSECPIDQAFPTRSQMKGEEIFIHKDGRFFDVGFTASPIRDVSGETVGTVIEVRDITQRKAIEKELREADRRKDEFIATLAHELRNPLAPISNLIELMKRSEYDPDLVRKARGTIERQLAKVVRLVDDLLDVSRITRSAIELRREPVGLASAIDDACEMCRPMVEQLGHRLEVDLPGDPLYVDADAMRLSQVLGNLINNACKFTPRGGDIRISADRENGDVLIKVKDSGIGIPPNRLANIFDMFSQIGSPAGESKGGLGIGLALAKQLIEMHGGGIEAKSDGIGTGSEFTVRLPALSEVEALVPETPHPQPRAGGRRILVVDDNADSAESMCVLLELYGNECRMAHSGPEAVRMAEEVVPDVILLDIGLPGMDGYQVCRTIRTRFSADQIGIIAMTGWGQAEDLKRSKEAGFNNHLVKPVAINELNELLKSMPARNAPAASL